MLVQYKTWVDLGSGNGNILKSIGIIPNKGIAVDINVSNISSFVPYKGTIEDFLNNYDHTSNDLVTLFDVIEHYDKDEALKLVEHLTERFISQIIFTPEGFLKQDEETHEEFRNNLYMWHRAGFCAEEFERLGYLVFVLKNYHVRPSGHHQNFNAILAFKNNAFSLRDYAGLLLNMRKHYCRWLIHPNNFISAIRYYFRDEGPIKTDSRICI